MLTMFPDFWSIMGLAASCMRKNAPFRLRFIVQSQFSSETFGNGSTLTAPALLTSTSMRPCVCVTACTNRGASLMFAASNIPPCALIPSVLRSASVSSSSSALMSEM